MKMIGVMMFKLNWNHHVEGLAAYESLGIMPIKQAKAVKKKHQLPTIKPILGFLVKWYSDVNFLSCLFKRI